MGLNFRKSFKVGGVRLTLGKKGLSSVSVGTKGARLSLGKKGARTTVSLPKTGLSYSTHHPYKKNTQPTQQNPEQTKTSPVLIGFVILMIIMFIGWVMG